MSAVKVDEARRPATTLDRPSAAPLSPPKPRTPAKRRLGWASRISVPVWRVIFLFAALTLWHAASIPAGKLLLPSPLEVAPAMWNMIRDGSLPSAALSSLMVFIGG